MAMVKQAVCEIAHISSVHAPRAHFIVHLILYYCNSSGLGTHTEVLCTILQSFFQYILTVEVLFWRILQTGKPL